MFKEIGKSEKPKFEELGPYRFREKREKVKIWFSEDKSEVNYRDKRWITIIKNKLSSKIIFYSSSSCKHFSFCTWRKQWNFGRQFHYCRYGSAGLVFHSSFYHKMTFFKNNLNLIKFNSTILLRSCKSCEVMEYV